MARSKKYSSEQLQEAVKKAMAGEISQKKASTFCGVPVMTLGSGAWQGDILF